MMSKETLLAWLDEHGQLTADATFDIHDGYDVALDAASAVLPHLPKKIGFWSRKNRIDIFYSACTALDGMIERGRLEVAEALVALSILRANNAPFRKALHAFERKAAGLRGKDIASLPGIAQEYLAALKERFSPLVAG